MSHHCHEGRCICDLRREKAAVGRETRYQFSFTPAHHGCYRPCSGRSSLLILATLSSRRSFHLIARIPISALTACDCERVGCPRARTSNEVWRFLFANGATDLLSILCRLCGHPSGWQTHGDDYRRQLRYTWYTTTARGSRTSLVQCRRSSKTLHRHVEETQHQPGRSPHPRMW